ncbi:MAG: hypothetical protein UV61_C0001G0079 [Candidatus Gottesmanbacteria bacterium GW2011_GWB1_43_11]|uniref:Septum formation initiator n=1 Tax=Candidatus Gottesmanbacteria bacterium GW2011_GWB1_43_11 TaxID=1618446 RepID=A0A0G1CQE7_9BACT|nr:MAG: hypothetical protein UV04_C0004G0021 [Candidatus Gottesmanbacteria bacterium GW2011_GWA2_42_16]KKS56044.1 MAG: hypothetical protein UV17_C0003G0016 [Candidatus Gottesmanbacteria bacterium GW2011_GWA1_42_26]KKS81644.1 MAG: hypothetical protein UV55_C0011G0038 [Candidatus Gottesmanbacteria bacterium GW2011_GWC1_43_10]KKS87672.1 MAG: hypothetical protein UV61_C0001G0079 [Candidatus Gottesmanbacteria bacterium GW2011_GWB1_43_11]OGG07487.1 MAG: hypothetical protein A2699_00370 [Candidatus Go
MSSRFLTLVITLASLIFIVNISRSIWNLWQKGSIVSERQAVRDRLLEENAALKSKLQEVESPEFIEKQAREKLNLQKEGEVVVVLPKDLIRSQPQAAVEPTLPNWQRWWKVFF